VEKEVLFQRQLGNWLGSSHFIMKA